MSESGVFDHKTHRQLIGRVGEDAVARRYAEMGFSVVARNLHLSRNEIDLILQNETHLVFVEVTYKWNYTVFVFMGLVYFI